MDVLTLLRSKNRYLDRFEQASLRFLDATSGELDHASFLTAVQRLELTRERILKALGLFNKKLLETIEALPSRDEAFLGEARTETEKADLIVSRLLELDSRVSERIKACQERITLELAASEKSKSIINKFKSSWAEATGGELDRKL